MKIIPSSKKNRGIAVTIIFLAAIGLIVWLVSWLSAPSSEIRTWYDLNDIRNNLEAKYVLTNNLDSSTAGYTELASPTANKGKGWEPIGTRYDWFEGIFDGQGYEICDLFINRPEENDVGVFRVATRDAYITNIGVLNVNVTGSNHVGGLAGKSSGSVSYCYSTGDVTGHSPVGGLVGSIGFKGTVSNSYSTVSVTGFGQIGGLVGFNYYATVINSYSNGSVSGDDKVGGLVGFNYYATVSNCYSTGSVDGDMYVGGLVGYNYYATVSNSYSNGSVTNGGSSVCGLVGFNVGTVGNSFWNTETSGKATSAGGTGKNTAEMQDITTWITWDLIVVDNPSTRNILYTWNIVDDETYPFLSWEPVS